MEILSTTTTTTTVEKFIKTMPRSRDGEDGAGGDNGAAAASSGNSSKALAPRNDRFIPARRGEDDEGMSHYLLTKENNEKAEEEWDLDEHKTTSSNNGDRITSPGMRRGCNDGGLDSLPNSPEQFRQRVLQEGLLPQGDGSKGKHRVLAFRHKAPAPQTDTMANQKVLYSQNRAKTKLVATRRHISSMPVRVLDAPDLMDDFYLNLVSWGSTGVLAVALGQSIYLWDAETGGITELATLEGETDYIASVAWIQQGGTHLAVGTGSGKTQLWDVRALKQVRTMGGHSARVSSLAWNRHILTSGGKDANIIQHDVRVANHAVTSLKGHTQEVCGLAWSNNGTTLASGSNDNSLRLWESNATSGWDATAPRHILTDHSAAVKALAWCPFERGLLASGGGTADRTIKFWNSSTGALLNSIDAESQVCSVVWSRTSRELVSSHGFARNQLVVWSYPSMGKLKELTGHSSRVLHTCLSPDGKVVASAAADETLRFWEVFPAPSKSSKQSAGKPMNLR